MRLHKQQQLQHNKSYQSTRSLLLCLSLGLASHAHAAMLTKLTHSEEDRRKQELKALTVSGSHAKTFTFGQKHH